MQPSREAFKHWLTLATHWEDVDVYGHVNNVKYYAYFDTVIDEYLVNVGGLRPSADDVVGYVVESHCHFHAPFHFQEGIEAGLRVVKISTRAVTYEIGLFGAGENQTRAHGEVVHVFVERARNVAVPIPQAIRAALERLQ
jgi:acyl-CoA thioester hydrolase